MTALPRSDSRSETFGYACRRCSLCCYNNDIRVNPYEVARLARNLGQTTTKFRATWTRDGGGTMLNQTDRAACVFLGSEGCIVYSDRPLACRLYPLGRHVAADGSESFMQLEGHPQSAGEFTNKGTISQFLESQEAEPFIQATDEYFHWACAAHVSLRDAGLERDEPAAVALLALDLLDMDAAIARHCEGTRTVEPLDIDERKRLHLAVLYEKLADFEKRKT
jgi:Fe-S-cluster containining protein